MDSDNSKTQFENTLSEIDEEVDTYYMSAWQYYIYATNYKTKRMNGKQYRIWRRKMYEEGKSYFFCR